MHKSRYYKAKWSGLCTICCSKRAVSGICKCRTCWFKAQARRHLNDYREWRALEQIYRNQGGRCAYTGERISIGRNASLEHIFPKSKYWDRKSELSNICFVSQEVNTMKGGMSLKRFLRTCKLVLINMGFTVQRRKR